MIFVARIGLSMGCYWAAYGIVTLLGILHTCYNILVLGMGTMKEGPGMGEGYERTKPWHPLYNLLIFPFFAWLYLRGAGAVSWKEAAATALLWGTLTVVVDLVGWVLIKHPWSLTPRAFYLDYQPWITLIYITIYASPLLAFGWMYFTR